MSGEVTPGLRALLGRLQTYIVDWKFSFVPSENVVYEPGIDREAKDLNEANIVSSAYKQVVKHAKPRHAILLDLDIPAHLVASSTPGHSHLYIEVPGGVDHDKYMNLLEVLADCSIIEKGYAEVSIKRGHSDLRLPWVTKADMVKHKSGEDGVDLKGLVKPEPAPVPVVDLGGLFDGPEPF